MPKIVIKDIIPKMGLPGGAITIKGKRFKPWEIANENLYFPNSNAWIDGVSDSTLLTSIPDNSVSGHVYININGVKSNKYHFVVPKAITDGLHIVDNPVIDSNGNIYTTYSGGRGESTNISVFKINQNGEKEVYIRGLVNATSLLIDNNDTLYIVSRFDGKVYRSFEKGTFEIFSHGLGAAFGMAMNSQGEIFVGDRNGSIFKLNKDGLASFYSSIPSSYIAFHLAFDSKDNLYVSNPAHMGENCIYKIDKEDKKPQIYYNGLSLFHGFAFDSNDVLYLVESKRNESCIIKVNSNKSSTPIITGRNFIGLSFGLKQSLIIATASSLYSISKDDY